MLQLQAVSTQPAVLQNRKQDTNASPLPAMRPLTTLMLRVDSLNALVARAGRPSSALISSDLPGGGQQQQQQDHQHAGFKVCYTLRKQGACNPGTASASYSQVLQLET